MTVAESSTRRVAGLASSWPLHDAAATRLIEQRGLASTAEHALMARAGLAVARLAIAVAPHARHVAVLAGPGNNGGDGLVAARHLHAAGRRVRVVHLADGARLPSDAAWALGEAQAAGVPIDGEMALTVDDELIIDALLGLGISRPPEGGIAAAITAANAHPAPALAVDIPSGLDGDRGVAIGDAAIHSTWTLALLTLKPGLFTAQGRDHAGDVWLDRLAADTDHPPSAMLAPALTSPCGDRQPRRHAQHKGSFGDVFVVGGSHGMQGALWLAARAALAAGSGRVYASGLAADAGGYDAASPELMFRREAWSMPPGELGRATVVCGCGGGNAVGAALPPLLAHAACLVIDADALNAIAADRQLAAQLEARGRRGAPTVLTPHPLEAARLLESDTARVQRDRLAAAASLAGRFGAVVVLKGSGTVIARPGEPPWINATGNALLATAGTGDVLAGWIGGHAAALGVVTKGSGAAWDASRHAAWLHGRAADRHAEHSRLPLTASALIAAMQAAAS